MVGHASFRVVVCYFFEGGGRVLGLSCLLKGDEGSRVFVFSSLMGEILSRDFDTRFLRRYSRCDT